MIHIFVINTNINYNIPNHYYQTLVPIKHFSYCTRIHLAA